MLTKGALVAPGGGVRVAVMWGMNRTDWFRVYMRTVRNRLLNYTIGIIYCKLFALLYYTHMVHEHIQSILKTCGVKVTKQRIALLQIFNEGCKPISAEDIFTALRKKVDIDLATVYRNLLTLEQNGVIQRVDLRTGSQLYELKGHHHHHVVCTECGTTEHFDICIADTVTKKVLASSKKFKNITDHALELFGVCSKCTK